MRVDAFKDTFDDPARLTLRRLFWRWLRAHKLGLLLTLLMLVAAGAAGGWYLADKYRIQRIAPVEAAAPGQQGGVEFSRQSD